MCDCLELVKEVLLSSIPLQLNSSFVRRGMREWGQERARPHAPLNTGKMCFELCDYVTWKHLASTSFISMVLLWHGHFSPNVHWVGGTPCPCSRVPYILHGIPTLCTPITNMNECEIGNIYSNDGSKVLYSFCAFNLFYINTSTCWSHGNNIFLQIHKAPHKILERDLYGHRCWDINM